MLIATLTTSYNRKFLTLKSLGQLHTHDYPKDLKIKHYLVDDCSNDGTPEIIKRNFNDVEIIKTPGNLYWSRSMNLGWEFIKKDISPDFIFVYNDDSDFYENCISKLLKTYFRQLKTLKKSSVIVGSLVDPKTKNPTYGGRRRHKIKLFTLASRLLPVKDFVQEAYTLNFNAALIPSNIIQKIGFVAPYFYHGGADWEYGYRCVKNKIPIFQAEGSVGTCSHNSVFGTSREPYISLLERYKRLLSIKEQPFLPRLNFTIRYGGILFIVQLFVPYLTIFFFHFSCFLSKKFYK